MEGYGPFLDPARTELALARGDLAEVERILSGWTFPVRDRRDNLISRLNALVALGRDGEIELEAPPLIRAHTYPEPFALRALGIARGDDAQIGQAINRFEALGLHWFADQTRRMAANR
ncbi:MAG: hypothetical protein ACRDNP_08645 [Gaiellaceae bacterium]